MCEKYPDLVFKHYSAVNGLLNGELWKTVRGDVPTVLRIWQKEVLDCLLAQNDRKICFVIDEEGGMGKSVLAKYICKSYDTFYCTGGKQNDLAFAYKSPDHLIAIFDLSRNPHEKDFHPYAFAEQLKNGMFSSGKYESQTKFVNPPKVIWFMNQEPDRDKLSHDRYCVHRLQRGTFGPTGLSVMAPVQIPPPLPPSPGLSAVIDELFNETM